MLLSVDEQRILQQIEQQFYESDPAFARGVSSTTLYRHAFRNLKWAVLAFVAGLAFLVVTLAINFWLAAGGFVVMFVALIFFERNARKLGRAGLEQVTKSLRAGGLREYFSSTSQRMRDRFKRDE